MRTRSVLVRQVERVEDECNVYYEDTGRLVVVWGIVEEALKL